MPPRMTEAALHIKANRTACNKPVEGLVSICGVDEGETLWLPAVYLFGWKPNKEEMQRSSLLRAAQPLTQQEAATTAWFAIRFGRSEYGIFDVFPDEAGRDAHLAGPIAKALMDKADELLVKQPSIRNLDILADKLPDKSGPEPVTKGLLLTFKPKAGHEQQVEQFLRDAKGFVEQEPKTLAWFGLRVDNGHYGIFDVFPDNGGRFSHLAGHIPRELAKHSLSLLGSMPDLEMLDIIAAKPVA
jgi:quinol monooxygenase YgiN